MKQNTNDDREINVVLSGLVGYLQNTGKKHLLPHLAAQLHGRTLEQTTEGEVITAIPLSGDQRKEIEDGLSQKYGIPIIVKNTIRKNILGGIIVRFRDMVIDESLATMLNRLKKIVYNQ